jgi:hypothetical protein
MSRSDQPDLTLLFDGGCPLCVREVRFLRGRDRYHRIAFVDIDAPDYDPTAFAGISYRMAMGRIHALKSNGDVLPRHRRVSGGLPPHWIGLVVCPNPLALHRSFGQSCLWILGIKTTAMDWSVGLGHPLPRPMRALMKKWGKGASTNCVAPERFPLLII